MAVHPQPAGPAVSVVVPTYRRPEGLARLLAGLERQSMPADRFEVVVVDNASGPEYAPVIDQLVAASPLRIRIIRIAVNRGPAAARNRGWQASLAPVVAFTDDDCVPQPEWLEAGLRFLDSRPGVGVLQGRTVRPTGSDDYPVGLFTAVREVLEPSPWFEGCNLFLRRSALEAAGGFDEAKGYFAEETAMAWSAIAAGWERGWADGAVVEHELAERPWRWHLKFHWLQGRLVDVAADHPAIRQDFWQPWAVSPEGAWFALAALGAAGALTAPGRRSRLACVSLGFPYLIWLFWAPERRPPLRGPVESRPGPLDAGRIAVFKTVTLGAAFAGKVCVGLRRRTLLL
jgi:GT2 family glycosyltransferase